MKLFLLCTVALQAFTVASGATLEGSSGSSNSAAFWSAFIEDADSFPSTAPSPSPTAAPSPIPTEGPTPSPSAEPSSEPSPAPSPGPSPEPSETPSAGPTRSPVSGEPSPAPSPAPSPEPSAEPSAEPSPAPSSSPSVSPTGECSIDSCLNCTTVVDGTEISCEEIPAELKPVCSCAECVRTLSFIYTGKACPVNQLATGKCTDSGPNPFVAGYRITNALDETEVLATGQVQQGDEINIDAVAISGCIPDTLAVTISVPTGAVTQTFTVDSSCDGGRGLILIEDYGAFEAYGYSCSSSDAHNCRQDVAYGLKVCNTGTDQQRVYDFFLREKETISDEEVFCDITENVNAELLALNPGECYYDTKPSSFNRCQESSFCVDAVANATNPITGIPKNCPGADEMKFGWPGLPTLDPTPSPSPEPTIAPSPAPTSTCVIDIELTGCPEINISLDNNCEGRPQVITFRYLGGDCSQSDNLQPRQKFFCEDSNGGPPTVPGTQSFITATPAGGSDLYFEGNVAVGDKYTLNEDKTFDKLSADMTISIFSAQGGSLLQTTNLHLSCSQPLFLFDKFGSSQVTQWIETSGRIVSDTQTNVPTGTIVVQLDTAPDIKPVRLTEMQVITSAQDEPIDYTSQVAGQVLEPGVALELPGFAIDIELGQRVRYTFFTTIIGETLDGTNQCNGNSFLECTVGFNLDPVFPTNIPTPRPTITPFPTGPLQSTACEIASNIGCTVTNPGNSIITCDRLRGDVSETCPQDQQLLTAFLKYDGSLGESVFVVPTCGKSEYNTRTVKSGEIFEFRTRASDTCEEVTFEIYDTGDSQGNGEFLDSADVQIACPGPWTIGNEIAPGLTLDYYVSTSDGGSTFNFNVLEAEVQIDYTGSNTGRIPLTVNSGGVTAPSPFQTGSISVVPVTLGQQSRQVLQTETKTIQLAGQSGQTLEFSMSLFGASANQFAIPCETTSTFQINL